MKKIFLSTFILVFSSGCIFASSWVTITVYGAKTGPTTTTPGSVTFNCDYTISTCGQVVVLVDDQQVPQKGDPTTVTTYMNGQQDAQYSGGYVSMDNQQEQDGSTTYTVTLSDLQED